MTDKKPGGHKPDNPRSPQWESMAHAHLKVQPYCQVCGTTHDLQVHHEYPFHVFPQFELDPSKLITMCGRDHLFIGHLGEWASWNVDVRADAARWWLKIHSRPHAPVVPGQ